MLAGLPSCLAAARSPALRTGRPIDTSLPESDTKAPFLGRRFTDVHLTQQGQQSDGDAAQVCLPAAAAAAISGALAAASGVVFAPGVLTPAEESATERPVLSVTAIDGDPGSILAADLLNEHRSRTLTGRV